jgi:hypothetical protein
MLTTLNIGSFAVWLDTTGGDAQPSDLPINHIPLRVNISFIKKNGDIENLIMNAINYYEIKIPDLSSRILIGSDNDLEIQTKLFHSKGYKSDKNFCYNNQISETNNQGVKNGVVVLTELRMDKTNLYDTANVNWHLSLI